MPMDRAYRPARANWGFAGSAFVLLGALAHEPVAHLIEGLAQVVARLGGVSRRRRFDRMSTMCHPGSGRLKVGFGPVAVHYRVGIDICPPRHAWRKGAVEKSAHVIAQRWWRTLADDTTLACAPGEIVTVRHQLGTPTLDITTAVESRWPIICGPRRPGAP